MVGIRRSTTSINRGNPLYADVFGWWTLPQFMGAGGLLPDLSGWGGHGTLTNMDPATDWISTQYGLALDFDGSNDFVRVANNAMISLGSGSLITAFQTAGAGAGFRGIMVKQDAFGIFLNGGSLSAYDWTASAERPTGVNLADGKRHTVAMAWASGVANGSAIYIDGRHALTMTYTPRNQTMSLTFGSGGWTTGPTNETGSTQQNFAGQIEGGLLSSRIWSASEVAAITDQWQRASPDALRWLRGRSMVSVPAGGGGATNNGQLLLLGCGA